MIENVYPQDPVNPIESLASGDGSAKGREKVQILAELKSKYNKKIYVPILVGVGVLVLCLIIIISLAQR